MTGGHGHVTPRQDGAKARCGGPSICAACAKEKAGLAASRAMTGGTFEWALVAMKFGNRARMARYGPNAAWYELRGGEIRSVDDRLGHDMLVLGFEPHEILATDWEIVEKPKS